MKKEYKFSPLPPEDGWKVFLIKELTDLKLGCLYLENERVEAGQEQIAFEPGEIEEILIYLCTT